MKPGTKKIFKWVGIIFGSLLMIALILGVYINSIIPKFESTPVVLQENLFKKPAQLFPVSGKYIFNTATELAALLKNKQITSKELITEYINNIKNNNYKYNALIYLREQEALEEAVKADEAFLKGDTINRPLLGIPITIKEMFWVKGSPNTMNAKMYGFTAPRNAEIVNQLKNAGAIILGTTNVPYMLSDYQTQGEVYPVANNPFDTTRTPGGSTGGGAAAVAAGFTSLELGSDLGGSIRIPAVFCGLWSLKPSFGTINLTDGSSPDSAFVFTRLAMASPGPLSRSAEDLQLAWSVLRDTKIDNRFQKQIDWKSPSNKSLNQYKIAWMDSWKTDNDSAIVSFDMKQKLFTFIDSLKGHQVVVEKSAPDIFKDLQKMFLGSFASMMGENQPWLIRQFIDIDFKKTDDGSGNFESFHAGIMDASDEAWKKIEADRQTLINTWEDFFKQYDFFICPVTYDAAFKKQESWKPIKADDGIVMPYMKYVPYSYIINATGHPAITVPLGLNKAGLPLGIQIIGPYYSEPELLRFANMLKDITPGFIKPNSL